MSDDSHQSEKPRFPLTRTTGKQWDKLKPRARAMRKEATPAEDILWGKLRRKQVNGFHFRRQHPIGQFIADFYCAEGRLVVEVDGAIHEEAGVIEYDAMRQGYLESLGVRVLRFTNGEVVQQLDGVIERIAEVLNGEA